MNKAVILTGGKSTRMGKDKYLLEVHGKPQYQYLYELIESLDLPVFLSCTAGQATSIPDHYQKIVDSYGAIGPIGGIASALATDPYSSWLVIACDLGFLEKPMVQKLMDHMNADADVITYQKRGVDYFETTISVYKPASFPAIRHAIASERYSLQKVLQQCKVLTLEADDEEQLRNVNYPDDLKGLKK